MGPGKPVVAVDDYNHIRTLLLLLASAPPFSLVGGRGGGPRRGGYVYSKQGVGERSTALRVIDNHDAGVLRCCLPCGRAWCFV